MESKKETPYVIEFDGITKVFNNQLVANDDIHIQIKRGEIHALLGENGAGKSTLMSILFGLIEPTEGQILLNGETIKVRDPNDATRYGIGMVHQHFMLVDVFTGLENIVLGHEDCDKIGFLKYRQAREKLDRLMKTYGLQVDLNRKASQMTVGMQQKVEILKMLYRDAEILIFDEPTAVLTAEEIEDLMKVFKMLQKEGKTILFITHKLNEVQEVADRCTILRRGKVVGTYDRNTLTNEQMAELMVGSKVDFVTAKSESHPGEVVLSIQDLTIRNSLMGKPLVDHLSLDVHEGEIVALLGIDGNGQNELVEAIAGLRKAKSGSIKLNGTEIKKLSIKKRNRLGINHIPSDRHRHGLILDYNVMYNFIQEMPENGTFSRASFLKERDIKDYADEMIQKYDIRSTMGSYTITRTMSGGNQQKVIVGREIERDGDLLLAVQPTRGLDVGAISTIHKEIVKVRDARKAVLLISLELDEVFDLADVIYTIHEGRITGVFDPKKTDYMELGLYMSGASVQEAFQRKEVK